MTGNALDSDISYFMNCGANHVMAKPFDLSLFEEILKKYNENQVGTEIIEKLTDFEEWSVFYFVDDMMFERKWIKNYSRLESGLDWNIELIF